MQRTGLECTVVGYDDADLRIRALHNHMAAALTGHYESHPFEGAPQLAARDGGWLFCHLPAQGQFNEFVPSFGGNGVSGGNAVFHIEFCSFTDTR